MTSAGEIVFLVEEAPDGGFTARALGHSIVTEADDAAQLHVSVRDAVRTHFDGGSCPRFIRIRFNSFASSSPTPVSEERFAS